MSEFISSGKPDFYQPHPGTVRIAGRTLPRTAAAYAFNHLQQGADIIDFFYIGGNAGQQAMKAMCIFSYLVHNDSKGCTEASFHPIRVLTKTTDPVTNIVVDKDAVVWRTLLTTTTK